MDFKEEYLYIKYRDKYIGSSEKFRYALIKEKFKDMKDVNISNLYRRIINYQIKKYGAQIGMLGKYDLDRRTFDDRCGSQRKERRKRLGILGDEKLRRWTV